jgi:anti-sigma regulatory factor (Ser/Thr protein kinase)
LSDVRQAIRSWAGDHIAATTIDDIVVAAGELVTNGREALAGADAFRHDVDTDIVVNIRPRGAVVILEVTSSGGPFDHIRAMPGPESERGRGLAIVGRLADSVALDSADGRVTVSARFSSGENLTT